MQTVNKLQIGFMFLPDAITIMASGIGETKKEGCNESK